ncbi:MAG: hypothetical protein IJU30_06890 [Lachnospiraceae bacterium]|nr:hypothetical protein [Lachnospiraceae bacterium]
MDLSDYLKKRKTYLENKIESLESNLTNAPEGRLACAKSNGNLRWYVSDSTCKPAKYTYLNKSNYPLIRSLILRDMNQARLKDLNDELTIVNAYIDTLDSPSGAYRRLVETRPHYLHFLGESNPPLNERIQAWLAEEYPYNPERKNYTVVADNGLMVLSKSEALIIRLFIEHNIPFRYECPVEVFETIYYPDFTIMHPRTGQILLWEHFGLMERDYYAAKNAKKVADYRKLGYFPFRNFLMTFEYSDMPFDITTADDLIIRYLS